MQPYPYPQCRAIQPVVAMSHATGTLIATAEYRCTADAQFYSNFDDEYIPVCERHFPDETEPVASEIIEGALCVYCGGETSSPLQVCDKYECWAEYYA